MHGLIFATWEKFLSERYGTPILEEYRASIADTDAKWALTSRMYDDSILIRGVETTSRKTGIFATTLLREYGRYFLNNNLTNHLCAYLLSRATSAKDLLMQIRGPLFTFTAYSDGSQRLLLQYDSNRFLCSLMVGCIEGAADRFKESVRVQELSCMRFGAPLCLMDVRFERNTESLEDLSVLNRQSELRWIADEVLKLLPPAGGYTLPQIEMLLRAHPGIPVEQVRRSATYNAVTHLQHAGLVASSADIGDLLQTRRYRRV